MGAVQHHGQARRCRARRCWSTRRRTTRRRRSSAAGRRATDSTARTARSCASIIRGWAEANDYLIANSDDALEALQKKHYQQVPLADLKEQYRAQKMFTAAEWRKLYRRRHGDQVAAAGHRLLRPLRRHPEPGAGVEVLRPVDLPRHDQGLTRCRRRQVTTTSSSAPVRRAACSRTGCRRIRRRACCCSRPAARSQLLASPAGRLFPHDLRHAFSRLFDTEPCEGTAGRNDRLAARPRHRRLVVDQRADLHSRPARGLRRLGGAGRDRLVVLATCCRISSASSATRRRERSTTARAASSASRTCATTIRTVQAWVEAAVQYGLPRNPGLQRRDDLRRRRLPAEYPQRLARELGARVPASGAAARRT